MSPLAARICKELTLPLKRRTFSDWGGLLKRLDDIHCFECSEAMPLLPGLYEGALRKARAETKGKGDEALSYATMAILETMERVAPFLPAPKTWIEWRERRGGRVGCLLEIDSDGDVVAIIACSFSDNEAGPANFRSFPAIGFRFGQFLSWATPGWNEPSGPMRDEIVLAIRRNVFTLLCLINSPRVIGRRTWPARRDIARKLGRVGVRYTLLDWTEIKLEITLPRDASGDAPPEGRLTGAKALHFCRAHLRLRHDGRVELVSAHWRGDAALGIKQQRYSLTRPA